MSFGELHGHVIDDVRSPWKAKVVTPICLGPIVLKTAENTELLTQVTMEYLLEMAPGVSNINVSDDVTRLM